MTISKLPATFDGHELDIIIIGHEKWLMGVQLVTPLGLESKTAIRHILRRNPMDFGVNETMMVELPDRLGRMQITRLFSERGCIKLAMLASTPKAAAFRDWAARVLTSAPAAFPAADTAALAAEVARLTTQRDTLAQQLLVHNPALARVARFIAMGHSGPEVALLMRWKTETPVRKARRTLEAMGILQPVQRTAAQLASVGRMRAALAAPANRAARGGQHVR